MKLPRQRVFSKDQMIRVVAGHEGTVLGNVMRIRNVLEKDYFLLT